MITLSTWIAVALASVAIVIVPGPTVTVIIANSLRHGMRIGIVTSLGTTLGIALQLLIAVLGLAALIELVADALTWIKWLGVVYLLYLGLRTWNEPASDLSDIKAQSQSRATRDSGVVRCPEAGKPYCVPFSPSPFSPPPESLLRHERFNRGRENRAHSRPVSVPTIRPDFDRVRPDRPSHPAPRA